MSAYVICCNDSVEYVVVPSSSGSDAEAEAQAKLKLEELAKDYYDRHQLRFEMDYAAYRKRYYWHIHETPWVSA